MNRQAGTALVVGLLILSLITLLGLAGAAAAQVELQLARNEQFRENAAAAASAGIESAISHVSAAVNESVPTRLVASLPGGAGRFEAEIRFLGLENGLPQIAGANLAGAHYEILSTGFAARNASQTQRALVMHVIETAAAEGAGCEPEVAGVPCSLAGELLGLAWQRVPP